MPDFNSPVFEPFHDDATGEGHAEPGDQSFKSNVKNAEHPIFSANGMVETLNYARGLANTSEKLLTGIFPDKVLTDLQNAIKLTGVPADLLIHVLDWEKDMTSRSDAGDATGLAKKLIGYVGDLKNTLGRDPMKAEVFMAHVTGSASKVQQILQKAKDSPEDDADPLGTQKDDIVMKKLRNKNPVKRSNRELYSFFYKRIGMAGLNTFKLYLGKVK